MKQKKTSAPTSRISIEGQGRDEWKNRYFKFAVAGSNSNIPPFSAKEIMENSTALFVELTNAGASAFQRSARNQLLQQLDALKPQAAKFKVVARLGWNSGAFVLPNEIIGEPNDDLGTLVPALGSTTPGQIPGEGNASRVADQHWKALSRQFPAHVLRQPRPYGPHSAPC